MYNSYSKGVRRCATVTNGMYGDARWLLRGCKEGAIVTGGYTVVAKMLFGIAPLLLSSFKKVRHSYYKGVHGGAPCFQGV